MGLIVEHIKESNSDSAEALPAHDIAFIKKQNEAIESLNRSLQLYDILYQDTMRKITPAKQTPSNSRNNSQSSQQNRNRTASGNLVTPMMVGPRLLTPTSVV